MISILIIALICLAGNAPAQDLITDRPDFTESALAIPAGMIQIESGLEIVDAGGATAMTFPNALARIGLGHAWEARFGLSGWNRISANGQSETYLNDILLEAKYQMTEPGADLPIALLFVSTLPTGDDAISVGAAEAGLVLALSRDLNESTGWGLNIGAVSAETAGTRGLDLLGSLAFGFSINDRLGAFLEVYSEAPHDQDSEPVLDGGFTWLLNDVRQLDVYLGLGLSDSAPDMIVGIGFSTRFDTRTR